MKSVVAFLIVSTLISCSEWDRAAVGQYDSKEVNSSLVLSRYFKSRLEYNGKIYKGKWDTDAGKSANLVTLYFGDTIITGVILKEDCNCLEIDNDGFFDSKNSILTFKKK